MPVAWEGAIATGPRAQVEAWAKALTDLGAEAEVRDLGWEVWAAFCDEDRQLDPELAIDLLQRGAEREGARYLTGRVREFADGVVELDGGERIAADALVVATGADQSLVALAPELGRVTPIKGHILRARGGFVGCRRCARGRLHLPHGRRADPRRDHGGRRR